MTDTTPRIVISGASGALGRHITEQLLGKHPTSHLTLATRNPSTVHPNALRQGVKTVPADFNAPASLEAAYAGNDTLMLISGLAVTRRVPEHRAAIDAATRVGISHIVYTSTAGIHPSNPTLSARDHAVTECDLMQSGTGYTILRNALYAESIAENFIPPALASGKWPQLAGDGRMAPVSKRDIARCAAQVLMQPGWHRGAIYEISGPELFSFRELAALAAEVFDTPIEYQPLTAEQRLAMFDEAGVPRTYREGMPPHPVFHLWASDEMMSADRGYTEGFHELLTGHVNLITGEPPERLGSLLQRYRHHS